MSEHERRMRVTYEIVSSESARSGDPIERGYENEAGIVCHGPYSAVQVIADSGALEPSSSVFVPRAWYMTPDPERDIKTGDETYRSYFPAGFPEDELRVIFEAVQAISRGAHPSSVIAEGAEEAARREAYETVSPTVAP